MAFDYTEKERKSGPLAWAMWWSRIRACQRFRQEYMFGERKWEKYYRIYNMLMWEDGEEMDYDISSDNPAERITIPIITSTILTIMPFLIKEKAEYFLDPKRAEDVVNVMLKQKVLNDEFHYKEIQSQLNMSGYDGIILGHGWAKSGFIREVEQPKSKNISSIEYDQMMDDESIYGKRPNPLDMWFDYGAPSKGLDTARFVIERYNKYLPDVLESSFYKQSVLEKIAEGVDGYKPILKDSLNSVYKNTDNMGWYPEANFWDYESQVAPMYEIWDKRFRQVHYFMEGVKEPLQTIETPYPYIKGFFPYYKMDFIYRPNEFYGMGVPEFVENQGNEINRHITSGFNHRRRFSARKLWIDENAIDPDEAEKIPDAEYEYIFVKSPNAIGKIDDVELPADFIPLLQIMKNEIMESTGADVIARGMPLQDRATFGEVQVRSNVLALKLNERIAAIDKMFLKMGEQLAGHIGAQYTKSRIVRLRGPQGEYWITVNEEDLKDAVDVRMQTVSAPKRNPEVESQQKITFISQILPVFLQLVQAGAVPGNSVNWVELLKFGLESFERVDLGRFFPAALQSVLPLQEMGSSQFQQQLSGGEQAQGATNSTDLLQSLGSGNLSGLQAAGGIV